MSAVLKACCWFAFACISRLLRGATTGQVALAAQVEWCIAAAWLKSQLCAVFSSCERRASSMKSGDDLQ
jgi:hypothetical protein